MTWTAGLVWPVLIGVVALSVLATVLMSFYSIGPTQIGLVRKRIGKKLPGNNPVAFAGEAGYQAELLMPGLRFKFKPFFAVTKYPWVQVPAGQIGVVIAQVGQPTPIGAKSARYDAAFGNFTDFGGCPFGLTLYCDRCAGAPCPLVDGDRSPPDRTVTRS